MTDNSPYQLVEVSRNDLLRYFKELAHLRKSQAGYRGWCGRYRREIVELEGRIAAVHGLRSTCYMHATKCLNAARSYREDGEDLEADNLTIEANCCTRHAKELRTALERSNG